VESHESVVETAELLDAVYYIFGKKSAPELILPRQK
jgi:hypothetical protein